MQKESILVRECCSLYRRRFHTPGAAAKRLYYYLQWTGYFECLPEFYIRRHSMRSVLLLQTVAGEGVLHYRGREYILDSEHVALIDCEQTHVYYPAQGSGWAFRFIHFDGGQSREICEHICELSGGCTLRTGGKLNGYIRDCMQLCEERRGVQEAQISQLLSGMLHQMILEIQQDEKDRMELVCEYVAEHYREALSVQQIAEVFFFSRCYLSTLFRKHTGTTLHDYLICYRLNRAKELLLQSGRSIQCIAEETGFGDVSTFIRAFQRKEHITPLKYRKLHA